MNDHDDEYQLLPEEPSPAKPTEATSLRMGRQRSDLQQPTVPGTRRACPTPREAPRADRQPARPDRPQPTQRPFASGIWSYPFQPAVARVWLVQLVLLWITAWLALTSLATAGLLQLLGLIQMLLAAGGLAATLLWAGNGWLTLMQETSQGRDAPDEWPRFDLFEAFGQVLYLAHATLVAAGCGILLGLWLPAGARLGLAAAFHFLLFPLVLFSMLDANSPVVPFTPFVGQSLRRARSAWLKFYSYASIPWLATLFVAWTCWPWRGGKLVVVCAVASYLTAVYFRLLGRLAWVLDQLPALPDESEESAEP